MNSYLIDKSVIIGTYDFLRDYIESLEIPSSKLLLYTLDKF